MKMRPAQSAGILTAAVLVAAGAFAGPGDGVRLGEVVFHPYLSINLTYDDNVYRSSPDEAAPRSGVNPEDIVADTEIIAATAPEPASESEAQDDAETPADWRIGVELGVSALNQIAGGRGALSLGASVHQTTYQDFSTEDGEVYRLRAGVRYATARELSLTLSDELRINTGGDRSGTTEREESTGNRVSAGVFWPVGVKTGLEFYAADDRVDYNNSSLVSTEDVSLGLNGHYRAFTRASTFLGYEHGWVMRDEGTNVTSRGDATYDQINGGVAGIFSPRLRGRISLGYQRRTYDEKSPDIEEPSPAELAYLESFGIELAPQQADDETTAWVGGAGLSYMLHDRTTADLSASQSVNESAVSADSDVLYTTVNFSLTHRFPSDLYVQGRISYSISDYQQEFLVFEPPPEGIEGPGTPQLKSREDNTSTIGLRIGYRLTEWADASLAYAHTENSSDLPGADYDNNLYTASFTARY